MTSEKTSENHDPQHLLASAIKRVATGPHMSKDISRKEAQTVMKLMLEAGDEVDPVRAAMFLVGLRIKRETDEENRGLLDALLDHAKTWRIQVPYLAVIADPFDGYARHLSISPALPAVLASCGVPSLMHGVVTMGPKFGVTSHQVIAAAGGDPLRDHGAVADRIQDPGIGWGYLDQQVHSPGLYALQDLRERMIKRPALATLEKLIPPLVGDETWLYTGYVHKDYERIVPLMARHAGFHKCYVQRGVEGGILPALNRASKQIVYADVEDDTTELTIDPADWSLDYSEVAPALPEGAAVAGTDAKDLKRPDATSLASLTAEAIEAVLNGGEGAARDQLILAALSALTRFGVAEGLKAARESVREAIDSGDAARRWKAGITL